MQDQIRILFDQALIYRISAAFGFFLYLAHILRIQRDSILIPSLFILIITWLGEFILIIAAQEIEPTQIRNLDLILDSLLSFIPPLILAKYLISSIRKERKIKNDIMFILGLIMLLVVVLIVAIILIIVIVIILLQGNFRVLFLLLWSFIGYLPILIADKYSQIEELESLSTEISKIDILLGTVLGKLVATPSKRIVTWLLILLVFLISYLLRGFFEPVVY